MSDVPDLVQGYLCNNEERLLFTGFKPVCISTKKILAVARLGVSTNAHGLTKRMPDDVRTSSRSIPWFKIREMR